MLMIQVVHLNGNGFSSATQQQPTAAAGNGAATSTAAAAPFTTTVEEEGVEGIQMNDRRTGQTGMFVRVSTDHSGPSRQPAEPSYSALLLAT